MTNEVQRRLQIVAARLADVAAEQQRLQAEHARLVLAMTDTEGADDQRLVAAR